jgi:hypothetical protein
MSSVAGVASPGAQAMANVAQTSMNGASSGPGRADSAQVQQFDALMQGGAGPAAGASQPTNAAQPGMVPATQMQPGAAPSSALSDLRAYGNELNQRFDKIGEQRKSLMGSLGHLANDPMMAMAQMMDFHWNAATTMAEYQLTLSVAQAANGVSHSLLKNQDM